MKRILSAGLLALVISGSALAQQSGSQSNTSGPGPTVGGFFVPSPTGLSGWTVGNLGRAWARTPGNSLRAAAIRAVGGALTGASGSVGTLTTALIGGNVPATQAGTLAQALATFGGAPTLANLQAAIKAYNDAVLALPAGTRQLSPAMRTVRMALRSFGSQSKAQTS